MRQLNQLQNIFIAALLCCIEFGCTLEKQSKYGTLDLCIDEVSEFKSEGVLYWVEYSNAIRKIKVDSLINANQNCIQAQVEIIGSFVERTGSGHLDKYQFVVKPDSINISPNRP